MARRNYKNLASQAKSKGKYKKQSEARAKEMLEKKLSKYEARTRLKVQQQMTEMDISYGDMLLFVQATERYNKNRREQYKNAEQMIVKPQWEALVKGQSEAWKARMFDDSGKLTTEGKQEYERFKDDVLGDIVPRDDKSIILSKTQREYMSFEKTLEARLRAGTKDYISERTRQYIDNYKESIKKNRENAQKFLDKYDELTDEEKVKFSHTAQGYIRYQYVTKNEDMVFQEFAEAIDQIISQREEQDNE